ncbi:MAG: hypothetical protein EHM20_13125 [Alphaproteobacteria bacterium]|nr:MAG: hypothetical protein EHM20_13125 [Alphaproteobacteria bacterium]
MDKLRSVFVRNVASTFLTMMFTLSISFVTSVIIARTLGPEKKGILSLAILVPNMLILFLNGGINISNAFFAGARRFEIHKLFETSIFVSVVATIISSFILILVSKTGLFNKLLPDIPVWAIFIGLLIFPFGLLGTLLTGILQGIERIIELNRVQLAQATISLVFTILLIYVFQLGLVGGLIASILTSITGVAGFTYLLRENWNRFVPRWHKDILGASFSFGMRGYAGNILQFFNYRLDVFIVNYFLGPAAVGVYAVTYGIAELLWNLPNAISFVFFPRVVSDQRMKKKSSTWRIFGTTMFITVSGGFVVAISGKFLISFLYSETFIAAYLPLLALLPGVVLLGGAKVLTAEILGRGYPQYNSFLSGSGLAITILGDLILVPKFNVLGAALASTISYIAMFLISIGFYLIVVQKENSNLDAAPKV